ncbi:MAG: aminotransferase class I/II-fold pyridoxal phosphate-dependent enzyme [Parvibaculales bacterium]
MSFGAQGDLGIGPFARLRALLDGVPPGTTPEEAINMTIGEPRHPPPSFVLQYLSQAALADDNSYGRYPPIGGLEGWRSAVSGWLTRRFGVSALFVSDHQILPVSGTREGLFLLAQLARPDTAGKTRMAMPNPFYQVYAAAALAAGAAPLYLNATAATGFLPDLDAPTDEDYDSLRAFFMCSPANPQGAVAPADYLDRLLGLAAKHDFLVIMDECYADIYDRALEAEPPVSALQVAAARPEKAENLVVFHSLSKRSNLPGLRSGFCAGGERIMEAFYGFRLIAGPQTPIATLNAAALAWGDDDHAAASRALYQEKFDLAESLLGGRYGFYRPQGGFFLWLDVGDGVAAAQQLWQQAGLRVLPGAYLSRDTQNGNPGDAYIRLALVDPPQKTEAALLKLRECLDENGVK